MGHGLPGGQRAVAGGPGVMGAQMEKSGVTKRPWLSVGCPLDCCGMHSCGPSCINRRKVLCWTAGSLWEDSGSRAKGTGHGVRR